MDKKPRENYQVEDFMTDESFTNYHFQLNKEDQFSWEQWLVRHPDKKYLVKEAKEIIQTLSLSISEKEYQQEFARIKAAINKKKPQALFSVLHWNEIPQYNRRKKRLLYLIPVILFFIIAGYFLLKPVQKSSGQLNETANKTNNPLIFTLIDSTVITLAPLSVLRYPAAFIEKERKVYLKGEAQFNVKRNEQQPFKVYTENMITTVLGTVFNIKKSGDSAIVVELLKGKLNVEIVDDKTKIAKSIILYSDEKATYVRHDQHFYKNQPQLITVSFYKNNFEEIAARVKKIFGITVINESNKKTWRFTGQFNNKTAKEIIENICLVEQLSSQMAGDTVFIKN